MNLAIDIGNSFTHVGVFNSQKLIKKIETPTSAVNNINNIALQIKSLYSIGNIGISSVVNKADLLWIKAAKKYFKVNPLFISGKIRLPIKLKVRNPEKLGADRICNAVAGFEHFKRKKNVIVIDLGTAVTFDVVLKEGVFIGGVISPGIETSAKSLHTNTSKLPLLTINELRFPKNPLGKNTIEAVSSGVMFSALDSMEQMVKRVKQSLKRDFKLILTGGFAKKIKSKTHLKIIVKENLVLEGINHILRFKDEN